MTWLFISDLFLGGYIMGYTTIAGEAVGTYTEKKSEFIAVIRPVKTQQEAVDFINEVKSQHRKARHNVYAYILREGNYSRYSDDGEPQGTAGVPVLDVLSKRGLTDVCVVVTRYFGGVLLGANGLVRAYSSACAAAADNAKLVIMLDAVELSVTCEYSLYGKLSYIMPEFEVKMLESDFGSEVKMRMLVKAELTDALCERLVDVSNGKIAIDRSDIFSADFA